MANSWLDRGYSNWACSYRWASAADNSWRQMHHDKEWATTTRN